MHIRIRRYGRMRMRVEGSLVYEIQV